MADTRAKTVTLESIDGVQFVVSEAVAMQSQTIRRLIEHGCTRNSISLPNVHSVILAMVLEYCTKHIHCIGKAADTLTGAEKAGEGSSAQMLKSKASKEELKKWDAKFLDIDIDTLLNLILAAEYLDIRDLLDLTCEKAADMIKRKTPEEIRKTLGIKNEFTPEEEEQIRRENAWAFEEGN